MASPHIAAVAPDARAEAVALAVPVYATFILVMPYASCAVARLLRLAADAARAVVFSGSTRNSLVVLPIALAVPEAGALLPTAVVTKTLVELVAMLVYVRWVSRFVPGAGRMRAG